MGFSHIKSSEEFVNKLYTGVTTAKVLAVNPTKEALEALGMNVQKEPVYAGTARTGEKQMRVNFLLAVNIGEDKPKLMNLSFFINDAFQKGSTSGKYQVIDKYGRTAWATESDIETHSIPQYSNGPASIDKDYRKLYVGEAALEQFIRALLCLDDAEYYNSNTATRVVRTGKELEDCEGTLEDVKAIIDGNINELKNIVKMAANNEVKILLGVKNNNDGRQFQAIYADLFVKNRTQMATAIKIFEKNYNDRTKAGAYKTSEFEVSEVHEYKVVPTTFATTSAQEVPATDNIMDDIPADAMEIDDLPMSM